MAANMWKNSLNNVLSDDKILYETLVDFLKRNGIYFLNKPRIKTTVNHTNDNNSENNNFSPVGKQTKQKSVE
jgi:hypothetical protein